VTKQMPMPVITRLEGYSGWSGYNLKASSGYHGWWLTKIFGCIWQRPQFWRQYFQLGVYWRALAESSSHHDTEMRSTASKRRKQTARLEWQECGL